MGLAIVILAAGQGTRFKSHQPKILHACAGHPLVWYSLATARALRAERTVVVVSAAARAGVAALIAADKFRATTVVQRMPNGTAGAVRAALPQLRNFRGTVLVLYGDVPLLRVETVRRVVQDVKARGAVGGVLTTRMPDPTGSGRILRDADGHIQAIIEEWDADAATQKIAEINAGVICCEARWLRQGLQKIRAQNAKREYYLTDLAAVSAMQGRPLLPVPTADAAECVGVNSRAELAAAEAVMRLRRVRHWMDAGVTFRDPGRTVVDAEVQIGRDTIIEPDVVLQGRTVIGAECRVEQGSVLTNTRLGRRVRIKPYSVLDGARVGDDVAIGPFARLRPGARLDRHVRVGNFVEIKKSWLKAGAKANHLTYLGDATIGRETNVGCGTITCNYDGRAKHPTIIGDQVFVGSDTQFVAPVRVGRGAIIAAGSVITEDVPAGALAVARGRQVVKRHWRRAKRKG